jgi:hypothetical protein
LLIVAAMSLAACAVVDGPDLPPGGDPGRRVAELPIPPEQQELARSFAAVRGWDLCAMHDIPAATEITGFEPEVLEPGTDECTLSLGAPGEAELRDLTIAVSWIVPPDQRQPARDDSCSSVQPLMPGADVPWAIEVTWSPDIGGYPSSLEKPPCDVIRDYVSTIRPKLTAPPLRSAGLTSPALALAGLDPCAVVTELLTAASGGTVPTAENSTVHVYGPSRCAGSVSTGLLQRIRIEVEFDVDAAYAVSGTHSVAGRPADISSGHWLLGGCRAAFRATDTAVTTYPSDDTPTVEIMAIELDSCNGEQQVAELAEHAARLVPPAPSMNPDAQPLGDLDPPP